MSTKYNLTLSPAEYKLEVDSIDTTLSLSRVGGQGSQGPTGGTNISDLYTTEIQDGDILQYNATIGNWENKPHTLTTASLTDVDNTGKEEGAILLYDSVSSKYKATTQITNSNLYLIGGSF